MLKKKRILVAPLDWGLGHAARCVPIINELLNNNSEVIIAADRNPMSFLQKEFPAAESIRCPGYEISYPAERGNMALTMAMQVPKILLGIREENKWLKKAIEEKRINGVISDQRFGLFSSKVPCAFITHQVMVKAPFFENFLFNTNRFFIKKYNECWIPDYEGAENLSGDLSHKFPVLSNAKFIGPLSRFSDIQPKINGIRYKAMAIISGPEPQRSIFEKIILKQLKNQEFSAVVVRGLANLDEHYYDGNIEIHSHLDTNSMVEKILSSEIIISRPGYSTIMDLAVLNKNAIFIPTPGQTEQEYLAKFHHEKKHFIFSEQTKFNLQSAFKESCGFNGVKKTEQIKAPENIIRNFANLC